MKPQHEGLFDAALAAYDQGSRDSARRMLLHILGEDDHAAEAWLLLSYIEDNWHDQMQCARNALAVAPDLEDARLRVQRLEEQRLPDTHFSRPYPVVPAVQQAHDEAMSRYFQESLLEASFGDPLDDPDQCPYCGVVNGPQRRVCTACGRSLMRLRPPEQTPTGALRLAFALNFAVVVLLLLQLFPPLLWTWYVRLPDPSRQRMMMDIVFQQAPALLVAGDFTHVLTPPLFFFLLGAGLLRLVLLFVIGLGLRLRLRWCYYLGLGLYAFEALWALAATALGWTGFFIGGVSVLAAGGAFGALALAAANFTVLGERYRVAPEGRLKSGQAYWQLGQAYERKGMWAMAVAQYRAAVAAAPNSAAHYKSLGIGYNKLGRDDRALRILEQALRLDPTDLEVIALVRRLKGAAGHPPPAQGTRQGGAVNSRQ